MAESSSMSAISTTKTKQTVNSREGAPHETSHDAIDSGSPPPNWDLVHIDVGCARCGQDLRGLTEPTCPACALEFDWRDAVPLEELTCLHCGYHLYGLSETRCPECGNGFHWNKVLFEYRARSQPYFEYLWARRPIRSLWASIKSSLRPRRLWRQFEIHHIPPVRALVALCLVCVGLFVLATPTLTALGELGMNAIENLFNVQRRPTWAAFGASVVPRFRGYLIPWHQGISWNGHFLIPAATWAVTGFAAMILLRQSMRLCRVQTAHVLRVYAYATIPMSLCPFVLLTAAFVIDVLRYWMPWAWIYDTDAAELIVYSLPLLAVGLAILSIAFAYRDYLKMKHAWGVAIASQMIAVLAALCAAVAPAWIRSWGS